MVAWVSTAARAASGRALMACAALCVPLHAAAADGTPVGTAGGLPLWELGLGVGGLRLPHYRGSDQSHNWLLPVPYIVYRGRILKADREGARALLFDSDTVELDLSLAAGAPTRSRGNNARSGMPDLDPTLELGPNLNVHLARGPGWKLDLRAPVRGVMSVGSRPRLVGWNATPNLNLDLTTGPGWNLGVLAGPIFGTRRLHSYYYDVAPAFATPLRPAYTAPGGYAGSQVTMAFSRRQARAFAGAFLRYDTLGGARFGDSSLVRQRNNLSFGFAMSWVLGTSARTVPATD
jgi:outer membrane protein